MAESARNGHVIGIDISDEMIELARSTSSDYPNVSFEVATAEHLPFQDNQFTHAFSMESLYYYRNIPKALAEIHRVMKPGGLFVAVVDLYWENEATHQWIDTLKVPVELLSADDYRSLFIDAGFENISDERILDPRPVPDDYTSGSFKSREDYVRYRLEGSLMMSGQAKK